MVLVLSGHLRQQDDGYQASFQISPWVTVSVSLQVGRRWSSNTTLRHLEIFTAPGVGYSSPAQPGGGGSNFARIVAHRSVNVFHSFAINRTRLLALASNRVRENVNRSSSSLKNKTLYCRANARVGAIKEQTEDNNDASTSNGCHNPQWDFSVLKHIYLLLKLNQHKTFCRQTVFKISNSSWKSSWKITNPERILVAVPSKGTYGSIRLVAYWDSDSVPPGCSYRWINCIAAIAPRKKTLGTASVCTASHRTVKIG